ncbi:MAG: hypothetical protein ACREP9_10030, partial [Candidatus Dormibacteraceae bacterium]
MNSPTRLALVITVSMIVVVSLLTVAGVQSTGPTKTAAQDFLVAHQELRGAVLKARSEGYTSTDLLPISLQLHQLDYQPAPLWLSSRPSFYRQLTGQLGQLQIELQGDMNRATQKAQETSQDNLKTAGQAITQGASEGLDQATTSSLQDRLHTLQTAQSGSHTLQDFRRVDGNARQLIADSQALLKAQA